MNAYVKVSDHDYKFLLKWHFLQSCLIILINDFCIYMDMFWSIDCGEYKTFWLRLPRTPRWTLRKPSSVKVFMIVGYAQK